jgi:hypothetical protein
LELVPAKETERYSSTVYFVGVLMCMHEEMVSVKPMYPSEPMPRICRRCLAHHSQEEQDGKAFFFRMWR